MVSAVYTATRGVLGDTQVATGEVYKDGLLETHYQAAYEELFNALDSAQSPRLRCENYWDVPINTGYVSPATMGISNLGQVDEVAERGNVTSWAISAVTPGSGICTLTSAATSLVTGNQAVVYLVGGITDDIDDVWTVTVLSATSTRLNGCTATGTYTSGGRLSFSAEQFQDLDVNTVIDWSDRGPVDSFRAYAWEKGVLRFPPANNVRQIRVRYYLSGNAPTATTASTGIDDCLGFLSYRTAGNAARSKGMLDRAAIYDNQAVGPNWESQQIAGGKLQQLLLPGVRNLQRLPPSMRRSPSFGGNRGRHKWLAW